jgi:hypothetical protein
MVWEMVAPILSTRIFPLMCTWLFSLACRHSQASWGLSSRNWMYRLTPAAENMPQYWATRVSITMHLKTGIILSCFT